MKYRRVMVDTVGGPAVWAIQVDPPLQPEEVEIDLRGLLGAPTVEIRGDDMAAIAHLIELLYAADHKDRRDR